MVGDGGGSDIIFIQDDSTVQGTLTAIDRRHAKKTGNCSNGAKSHTAGRHKRIKHAAQMKISGFIHGSPGLLRLLLIGWSLLLLDSSPGSLSEEKTWIALCVCPVCTYVWFMMFALFANGAPPVLPGLPWSPGRPPKHP